MENQQTHSSVLEEPPSRTGGVGVPLCWKLQHIHLRLLKGTTPGCGKLEDTQPGEDWD